MICSRAVIISRGAELRFQPPASCSRSSGVPFASRVRPVVSQVVGVQAREVPEEAQQGQAVLAPGRNQWGTAMLEAARAARGPIDGPSDSR